MHVCPINFTGSFSFRVGDSSGISNADVVKEEKVSKQLGKIGVSVPDYKLGLSYETKGENANFQNNKIDKRHLKNLFNNLFLMDKNNLNHNDLDIGHVFYAKDGDVQFDCFRFSSPFIENNQKKYCLPDFMMPTNSINYENASLAFYVEQMPDEKTKTDFIKDYLQADAMYHAKKAEFLKTKFEDIYTDDMLEYEELQAKILSNPDEKAAQLRLNRLKFLGEQRIAFTEFDEGNGACGHPFSKERRIISIPMYMDAVKSAIEYAHTAKAFAQAEYGDRAKYYEYEAKFGEFFANTYISWIQGMADYNFKDSRVCPCPDDERKQLDNEYKKIINANFDDKPDAIDNYLEKYRQKTGLK